MKLVERLMFLVIPSCRETQKLQSRNLDEKLSLWKRSSLWMHCVLCGWCRRYGKQIKFLNRMCSDLPECGDFEKGEPMPDETRERIEKCLCGEKGKLLTTAEAKRKTAGGNYPKVNGTDGTDNTEGS